MTDPREERAVAAARHLEPRMTEWVRDLVRIPSVTGEEAAAQAYVQSLLKELEGASWGRGACDMKGGLVAGITALAALREAGLELDAPAEDPALTKARSRLASAPLSGTTVSSLQAQRARQTQAGCGYDRSPASAPDRGRQVPATRSATPLIARASKIPAVSPGWFGPARARGM